MWFSIFHINCVRVCSFRALTQHCVVDSLVFTCTCIILTSDSSVWRVMCEIVRVLFGTCLSRNVLLQPWATSIM